MDKGRVNTEGRIVRVKDLEAIAQTAAEMFVAAAKQAIAERGRFLVALSGGSTPKRLYQLLASPEWKTKIDWDKVVLFWGDERCVPPTDAQNNYRMTREALLDHISVPTENVHRVMTELSAEDAAADYNQTVLSVLGQGGRFDFVLMGLGENGHTASLFPYRPTLHERVKRVAADLVPELKMWRITMTVPVLNAGRAIVFLVSGEGKAEVLHEVLEGHRNPERLPAQLISPIDGTMTWVVDEAAAARLSSRRAA